eukprot:CAMPEP_0170252412 /NCGR_PEP_ID=MMETSP0116_2-20130129/26040_1 /TAXON_ID=400756 /ORGANISM="Durinskia baltica, Strain CSIRO CS-38" /LENGTH=192 /DNA_ID=CAMNT_0010503383 /DNA_START=78 /DNA_END=656 /DNA_ORIENTATION=-
MADMNMVSRGGILTWQVKRTFIEVIEPEIHPTAQRRSFSAPPSYPSEARTTVAMASCTIASWLGRVADFATTQVGAAWSRSSSCETCACDCDSGDGEASPSNSSGSNGSVGGDFCGEQVGKATSPAKRRRPRFARHRRSSYRQLVETLVEQACVENSLESLMDAIPEYISAHPEKLANLVRAVAQLSGVPTK